MKKQQKVIMWSYSMNNQSDTKVQTQENQTSAGIIGQLISRVNELESMIRSQSEINNNLIEAIYCSKGVDSSRSVHLGSAELTNTLLQQKQIDNIDLSDSEE